MRFPGQYFDQELALSYNYLRDYQSLSGRYVESDPIGLAAALATYSYSTSNPLRFSDPMGLTEDSITQRIGSMIARGDSEGLQGLLDGEALSPSQELMVRQGLKKWTSTAEDWIGNECKGSINREFPGQLRDKTLKEIKDLANSGDSVARKAWKLLNDNRFKK